MAKVEVKQVQKRFGAATIIPSLDLTIESGEFMVLVGPSGCGKSTLLRMIAGLEDVSAGTLAIDGREVNDLSPKDRGIAMVFQNYALYPHMTVKDNLAFGLKLSKLPPAEIERRVGEAAKILAIEEQLAKKPSQLSGGQKQRVAMGRAMVRQPQVFLFDEPLSNLNAQLRVKMRSEISMLHRRLKATVVYVTHDQVEAMTLADRIAVMYQGRLEQLGTPLEVYHNPKTRFVASFIGTPGMNFLPASGFPAALLPNGTTEVGFRPEAVELGAPPSDRVSLGQGKVTLVEPLGTTSYVHVGVGDHSFVVERRSGETPAVDSAVTASVARQALFFFDSAGRRLGPGA